MYKKVTHTIVEEHFSHPMGKEIKEALDQNSATAKYKLSPISANKFRADINSYFTTLNSRFQSIFKNIEANNETALAEVEKTLFNEIDFLGDLYKPYYGVEFGERLNQHMRTIALLFIAIAKNLKGKMDIRDWRLRLDATKFDLANLLYAYNNIWRLPETQGQIGQIFSALISYAQAVFNKDEAGMANTETMLNNILNGFANSLADGTIQQFPSKLISP